MSVYFIADGRGHIKIGCSDRPVSRLASLQTGSPLKLHILATVAGGKTEEGKLHHLFSAGRVVGEWFRRSEMLDSLIEQANEWPGGAFDDVLQSAAETLDASRYLGRMLYSPREWAGCLHGRARPEHEDFA